MSEDKTKEMNDSRSFEERVFSRFNAIDERFDVVDGRFDRIEGRLGNVEIRIEKLDARQYDTKPIWEQALTAITELSERMAQGFTEIRAEFRGQLDETRAEFRGQLEEIRTEVTKHGTQLKAMEERFDKLETDLDNGFRGIERKMDVLNKYFLETRADQQYLDRRLEKIESQGKPS